MERALPLMRARGLSGPDPLQPIAAARIRQRRR